MNEQQNLREVFPSGLSKETHTPSQQGGSETNQAELFVQINTRVPARLKTLFQGEADARGVSMGVIITERTMGLSAIIDHLTRQDARLDAQDVKLDWIITHLQTMLEIRAPVPDVVEPPANRFAHRDLVVEESPHVVQEPLHSGPDHRPATRPTRGSWLWRPRRRRLP